ncbi:MAG: RNA polymerase sigma factor [Actinomycetota bacterium]|nr:RNA polymerase sigma factor [Actinomycetota bacterium]
MDPDETVDPLGPEATSDLETAIEAARRADPWAITCLFRAFQPQLLRYLRYRAPEVADDLASETWLATAKSLIGFKGGPREFRAWLFAIARRRLIDHYRTVGRRPSIESLEPDVHGEAVADVAEVVIDELGAEEALTLLLRGLPPEHAEVVVLRVVGGLSAEEVATVVGRSAGWVRTTQHRALRSLEERLLDNGATTRGNSSKSVTP